MQLFLTTKWFYKYLYRQILSNTFDITNFFITVQLDINHMCRYSYFDITKK